MHQVERGCSSAQDDHVAKVVLAAMIGLLVLAKVLRRMQSMTVVGIVLSALGVILGAGGTGILVYGEIARAGSFLKYRSSGEGKAPFEYEMRQRPWDVRLTMR